MADSESRTYSSEAEKDLFDALDRLKANEPTHPELIRKARQKKLRINPTTVAKEAKRARTLIGLENCAYPEIRKAIAQLKAPPKPVPSHTEIVDGLKRENKSLRMSVETAMSRVAAMALRMEALEKEAIRRVELQKRRAAMGANVDTNQVAGTRLKNTTENTSGNVVPLHPPKGTK